MRHPRASIRGAAPASIVAVGFAVAVGFGVGPSVAAPPPAPITSRPMVGDVVSAGSVCLADVEPETLGRVFDTEPGGVIGADYQRAIALPDGRVLWTFQDAAIRLGPDDITIVHNIAMLQDGTCFEVLHGGTRAAPESMFFADLTVPYVRWFWPLDAEVGSDGRVYVYAAEVEERGPDYLTETVPVGTWVAVFDPVTDSVVDELRPPNSSSDLYGWSITSDRAWTYLYAHCYRQFGFDGYATVRAFDRSCSADITVARVPRGKLFEPPAYWDGSSWVADPRLAAPVIETRGRRINADQIEWTGARFVSVNKEGDWWGDTILLSESSTATGPFRVYDEIRAPVKCTVCNSFFASWVPAAASRRSDGAFVISLAHNRWDGVISSFYRPTFHRVTAPTYAPRGTTVELPMPDGTGAAVVNVAAVGPHGPGFVTVYPCASGRPLASNVNHVNEPVVSNLVLARPDVDGRLCVYTLASTELVVDLSGTFGTSNGFRPSLRPERIVDTRIGTGVPLARVAAGEDVRFSVPISAGTVALALNVIAIDPSAPGFLTAYRCARGRPVTSNVNYVSEPVVSNLVVVPTGAADGSATVDVCISSLAEVDVVVDLAGSFSNEGFIPIDGARRLLDTRDSSRVPAGGTLAVDVASGVSAAVLNVIAVQPSAPGFITVFPCDEPVPTASNINYVDVSFVSNLVIARPSVDGRVCVTSSADTDVVVDLAGYVPIHADYEPLPAAVRVVDTRIGEGVPGQLGRSVPLSR